MVAATSRLQAAGCHNHRPEPAPASGASTKPGALHTGLHLADSVKEAAVAAGTAAAVPAGDYAER